MRPTAIAALLLAAVPGACSVANQDHCANLQGHATCVARGGPTPYCSKCTAANDGCVAELVADCDAGETTAPGTTTLAATTAVTTTAVTTTEPLTTTTGSTSDASTGDASTGSTGSTSSTGDESTGTTGNPPPMCGNDVREPGEICDGKDLNGLDCVIKDSTKYSGGDLKCAADCKAFDEAECCLASGQPCQLDGQKCCAAGQCLLECG